MIKHTKTIHNYITSASYPTEGRVCISMNILLAKANGSDVTGQELDDFYADFVDLVFERYGLTIGGTVHLSEVSDSE